MANTAADSDDADSADRADQAEPAVEESAFGTPGPPLERTPFYVGILGGLGLALAWWLATRVLMVGSILVLVTVAMFLAVGLSPAVEFFMRWMRRSLALLVVIALVLLAIVGFVVTLVPVISDQVTAIGRNAPVWFDKLQHNKMIQDLDREYDIVDKAEKYITSGDLWQTIFGGALDVGLKVLSVLGNIFVVVVLTLYFVAALPSITRGLYRLAPASRRVRVTKLGDQVLRNVGGYVSGAFLVALCAGISSLVFLFVIGLSEYAVALAFVVALLDVIPMIGATIGAVIVSAIAFATDPKMGLACVIFYIVYQQFENYVIYPRVMSRSVEIPGAMTVIAALIGASLLGVVGALMAIPTAAAILLIVREVWIPRQDKR